MSTIPSIVAPVTKQNTSRKLDNILNTISFDGPEEGGSARLLCVMRPTSHRRRVGFPDAAPGNSNHVRSDTNPVIGESQVLCFAWDWPSVTHVLFLRRRSRGPEIISGTDRRGSPEETGMAEDREKRGSENSSSPRGEGGEGRVRTWRHHRCHRFSLVHVFSGYVASLSVNKI